MSEANDYGKRVNIMAIWREFNPLAQKSMKDDFSATPSLFAKQIIAYLNSGELVLAAPTRSVDIFSGEKINQTTCILTDGEYSWSNSLGYYVQEYNLKIPKELEDKILRLSTIRL